MISGQCSLFGVDVFYGLSRLLYTLYEDLRHGFGHCSLDKLLSQVPRSALIIGIGSALLYTWFWKIALCAHRHRLFTAVARPIPHSTTSRTK
eukprot:scaffold12195_cov126-Cylindrotheca_fusiformis.AAC.4